MEEESSYNEMLGGESYASDWIKAIVHLRSF